MADQIENSETSRLIIEDPQSKASRCKRWGAAIWHVLREEFRCQCLGFSFPDHSVFYTAQWRSARILFLLYRLVLATYVVTFIMLSLTILPKNSPDRPWPVFMTNWAYFILTCHVLLSAVNTALHYRTHSLDHRSSVGKQNQSGRHSSEADYSDDKLLIPDNGSEQVYGSGGRTPWYFQLNWLIYCVAVPTALGVSIRYNSSIGSHVYTFKDFNNHVLNGVIALIDASICAIPVQLLHVVYSFIFFAIYYIFTYIFYEMDPVNNVLYPRSTDWRCPNETMISYVVQGILYPIALQLFLFMLYHFKLFICRKCHSN